MVKLRWPLKSQEKSASETRIRDLVQAIESGDLEVAKEAARVLGELGDPAAVEPLVGLIRRTAAVRVAAMAALKKISAQSEAAAVELAIARMKDKEEEARTEAAPPTTTPADRRRSPRVLLEIAVGVEWQDAKGRVYREHTSTKVVNAHGALVILKTPVATGQQLQITNLTTNSSAEARVAWVGNRLPDGGSEVGIELGTPDADFWVGKLGS